MRKWFALGVFTLLTLASVAGASAGQPEWWRNGGPRLRPQSDRLAALLDQGRLRSPTLRGLVEKIEANDVFVYIATNQLLNRRLAGSLTWMSQAGPFRYVRASISPDLPADQIIATLAHELQHVVEVIDDPGVVSDDSLTALYKRIGAPSKVPLVSGWETEAAQSAGSRVRRELSDMPVTSLAKLGRPKS
jgi:hypothetical protein